MRPFQPTVLRLHLDDRPCLLVHYADVCKALRVPRGYWLVDMHDYGETVQLTLIPKVSFACKRGIISKDLTRYAYTIRTKAAFVKFFGLEYEQLRVRSYRRISHNTFKQVIGFLQPTILLREDDLFMAFYEADAEQLEEECFIFTPEKTIVRKRW